MTEFTVEAYTDMYGEIEKVTLLSYDGNKYCKILRSNGEQDEIKSGYLYKEPYTFDDWPKLQPKRFPRVVWWKLEGFDKRNYIPRKERYSWMKKYWYLTQCDNDYKYSSLREAVKVAHKYAKLYNDSVEINLHGDRWPVIVVHADGYVQEFPMRQKNHRNKDGSCRPKFKKGLSKMLRYDFRGEK